MLELQSLQKEHQRREHLLKLQNDDISPIDAMMTIGKKTSFITNNDRCAQSMDQGKDINDYHIR